MKFIAIGMFGEQLLKFRECLETKASHDHTHNTQIPLLAPADLQYQLCSTFLKLTGQKLSDRQASLMENSQKFIDLCFSFRKKQIDSSQTLDTMLEEGKDTSMSIQDDHSNSLPRSKSPPCSPRRKSLALGEQLREIQQRCSYTCFAFINNLVAEYKAIEGRLRYHQNRQSLFSKQDKGIPRLHQDNLILRKKLELQHLKIHDLQEELSTLKQKHRTINATMNSKINSPSHSSKYFEINNKVYKDIKSYLQEKENLLKQQGYRISQMEGDILLAIQRVFQDQSCTKCCQILRKLKESILKFRKYFEGESLEFQRLYDRYKKTMYAVKSRPSL